MDNSEVMATKCPIQRAEKFRVAATGSIDCKIHIEISKGAGLCGDRRKVTGTTLSDDGKLSVFWQRKDADNALTHLIELANQNPKLVSDQATEIHGESFNPERMQYTATLSTVRAYS